MKRWSIGLGFSLLLNALVISGNAMPPAGSAATAIKPGAQARSSASRFERVYHKVWELVRDNYYLPGRLSAWNAWEHRYDGKLRTKDDLRSALQTMLRSLNDDYTYLLSDEDLEDRAVGDARAHVVEYRVLSDNVGYVRINGFTSDRFPDQLMTALKALRGTDGLVVDLRNNHGGYIRKAEQAFAMLAGHGTFMTYSGRDDGHADDLRAELQQHGWLIERNGRMTHKHRAPDLTNDRPMAVLVNGDTRSAAEMLAGALRINRHATIIGTKTFGKGVLQNSFTVAPGVEVKVVTAHYYLPDGSNIHAVGLLPDMTVSLAQSSNQDVQLWRAAEVVERQIAQLGFSHDHALAAAEDAHTDELR